MTSPEIKLNIHYVARKAGHAALSYPERNSKKLATGLQIDGQHFANRLATGLICPDLENVSAL
jgi:hypothetical protein